MGDSPPRLEKRTNVRVGLVVIGDEVLSGKVQDANTPFSIQFFRQKGIELAEVAIIRDGLLQISETVTRFSKRYDWVVTSGGVGPTHDDLTMDAVAHAFGVQSVESPVLVDILKGRGKELSPAIMRLARVPDGADFYWGRERPWPIVAMKNVFVLPGVPSFFASCLTDAFDSVQGAAYFLSSAYVRLSETDLVSILHEVNDRHSDVDIGSYPRFDDADYRVRITFEGRSADAVGAAMEEFCGRIPEDGFVRKDPVSSAPIVASA